MPITWSTWCVQRGYRLERKPEFLSNSANPNRTKAYAADASDLASDRTMHDTTLIADMLLGRHLCSRSPEGSVDGVKSVVHNRSQLMPDNTGHR